MKNSKFNKLFNIIMEDFIDDLREGQEYEYNSNGELTPLEKDEQNLEDLNNFGIRHDFFDLCKKIPQIVNKLSPDEINEFREWKEENNNYYDEDEIEQIFNQYVDKAWLRGEKKRIRDLEKQYEDEDEIYRDDVNFHRITYSRDYEIYDGLAAGAIKAPNLELLKLYWFAFCQDNIDEPDYDNDLDSIGVGVDLDTGQDVDID